MSELYSIAFRLDLPYAETNRSPACLTLDQAKMIKTWLQGPMAEFWVEDIEGVRIEDEGISRSIVVLCDEEGCMDEYLCDSDILARIYAKRHGWRCDETGDYCPVHAKEQTDDPR